MSDQKVEEYCLDDLIILFPENASQIDVWKILSLGQGLHKFHKHKNYKEKLQTLLLNLKEAQNGNQICEVKPEIGL